MSCIFNVEGRPKAEPNGSAECKLNWEAMGIIWDALGCLGKQNCLSELVCYTFDGVSEFDSFEIPFEDINNAELTDCLMLFFKDGVQYGLQSSNPDSPLYYEIDEQITKYVINLSTPIGETDNLSDLEVKIFVKTTFEALFTCDDRTCPE